METFVDYNGYGMLNASIMSFFYRMYHILNMLLPRRLIEL